MLPASALKSFSEERIYESEIDAFTLLRDEDGMIQFLSEYIFDGPSDEEEEEGAVPGGARVIPEDMLQTDTRIGSSCRSRPSLWMTSLPLYHLQVLPSRKSLLAVASKLEMPLTPCQAGLPSWFAHRC